MMGWIGDTLMILGAAFCFLGALGLIRMPDVYTRIQAGTKAVTLGSLALLIGIGMHNPDWWPKLLAVGLFILLTNPIGSSTLARAFRNAGVAMHGAVQAPTASQPGNATQHTAAQGEVGK